MKDARFTTIKLGAPVVPFYPFSFWLPLLKPNSRKKGTLIIKGPLGNLGQDLHRLRRRGRGAGVPGLLGLPRVWGDVLVIRVPLKGSIGIL